MKILTQATIKSFGKKTLAVVILLAIWQTVYALEIWPHWIFPGPLKVGQKVVEGLSSGEYLQAIAVSLRRLFMGFVFSIFVGGVLGFLLARIKFIRESIEWLVLSLQSLPSICWLPLALLWFGLNEGAILFVVVMGALLSVTLAVQGAIQHIPPPLIRAGKVLGARQLTLYRYVLLPAIIPELSTGLKQSWAFAWRSLMAGEMLFITAGLGQILMAGREYHDMAQVMSIIVTIMAVGLLFDRLVFGQIEKKVYLRWGLKK